MCLAAAWRTKNVKVAKGERPLQNRNVKLRNKVAQAFERGGGSRLELENIAFAQLGTGPWSPTRKGRWSKSANPVDPSDTSTNEEEVQRVVRPKKEAASSTASCGEAYERSLQLERREAEMKEKERVLREKEEQVKKDKKDVEVMREEGRREERRRLERLEAETQKKQQELKEWREERERQEKAGEWTREAYVERVNKEIDRNNALAEERRRHELSNARHYDYRRVAASDPETLVMEDSRKRLLTRIPAFADAGKTDSAIPAHVAAVKRKLFCDEVLLKEKREELIAKIRETDREGERLKERKRALNDSIQTQDPKKMGPPSKPPIKRHKSLPPCVNKLPKLDMYPLPPTRERQTTTDPLPLIYPMKEVPLKNTPIQPLNPPIPPLIAQPPTVRRKDFVAMSRAAVFDAKDRHPYSSHFRVTDTYRWVPEPYDISTWAPKPTPPSAKVTVYTPETVGAPEKVNKPLEQLMAEMAADLEKGKNRPPPEGN